MLDADAAGFAGPPVVFTPLPGILPLLTVSVAKSVTLGVADDGADVAEGLVTDSVVAGGADTAEAADAV